MAEHGRYLYAVCRDLDVEELDGLLGLEDAIVDGVEAEGLVGLVSSVDLDEYGEEGLRRNLESLDWLETAARGHDAVVQAAAALAPTAPMRLATVFRDDEGVRRRLVEQHDPISRVLDRIEGHEEWSVKVLTRSARDLGADGATPATSGTEYLRQRKNEQEAREAGARDAHATAERVHDALVRVAVASRRLPPQDPRLTGHTGTMVHNAAYLVPRGESDEFNAVVSDMSAAHSEVRIDARGPWPPYSFAMLDDQ
ncbi:MAG: GvpL/GvpF family gas vesicle protein [Nocardioides sp.]|nr:GvpL/GvpF family gas vesicle protein [Nocardioides sp.]